MVILSAVTLSSPPPVFFRSPSQAKERAGVFGAGVGPVGDPLVLQVQHFCGTGPVCGAAPLELWHPPQRGRSHRLGDRGSGRWAQHAEAVRTFRPSTSNAALMSLVLLIGHLGFVSLRNLSLACPCAPHAAAGNVLRCCADRLLRGLAHSSLSQRL